MTEQQYTVSPVAATADIGAWVSRVDVADVPASVLERLGLVLLDVVGVAAAGAGLPDQRALRAAWSPPHGPAPLFGTDETTSVDAAAWLNAVAMACLELDEGNKYAKGHPAVHGFPAVLALAAERDAAGSDTAAALLAAYEVAARFGRASTLRAGTHPHGNWGVAGAAAGCARLLGLDADACAAAVDAGAGMPIAGHFDSATTGNPVRDAWLGSANTAGLAAARMAAAGLARNTGTAALSLGTLLGEFDPAELTKELGTRWDITAGYFKRHASCSFTHPAADAVRALAGDGPVAPGAIERIHVETHALGAGLSGVDWDNRLSAMFSTPFVVAATVVDGSVDPRTYAEGRVDDPEVRELARRVTVAEADDLTARLPGERATRVTVRCTDGTERSAEVPNPVGDADHHPLDEARVVELLRDWLPGQRRFVDRLRALSRDLPTLTGTAAALRGLGQHQGSAHEDSAHEDRERAPLGGPTAMRVFAVTPIHVPDDEIRRRQERYDRLCPPGLEIVLHDVGSAAPRALDTDAAVRMSERAVAEALRTAFDEPDAAWDAALPDCVLDPAVPDAPGADTAGSVHGLLKLSASHLVARGERFGAVVRNEAIGTELNRRLASYGLSAHSAGVEVLDLPFDAIADTATWNAALGGAVARLAERGATAVLNGCSAVDVEPADLAARIVDPTALALRLLAVGGEVPA